MKKIFNPALAAAIGLLILASYLPSLGNQFVDWDDDVMLYNNPTITSFSAENIKQWFTAPHYGMYHPLVQLTYAVEYRFFGLQPFVYHLDNLLLHAANAGLILIFLWLLTDSLPLAFGVALLWGVHPVHVESVAWATERKDLLFAFFYFISLIFYLRYLRGRGRELLFSFGFFLLALLAKPMALSLPLVLLLCDQYRGRKWSRQLLWEKVPFFLLALVFGLISVWAKQATGGLVVPEPPMSIVNVFVASYRVLFYYLPRMIVPLGPTGLYPLGSYVVEGLTPLPPAFIVAPFILVPLLGLFFWWGRKSRELVFGGLFFLITLAPVIMLMIPGVFADRYAYLSSLGFYFIAGYFGLLIYNRAPGPRRVLTIGAVLVVLAGGALTWQKCGIWHDSISLYDEVCRWYPRVPAAFQHRGQVLADRRESARALADFNYALELNPKFTAAYNSRGNLYFSQGNNKSAYADFLKAVLFGPQDSSAHNNLGYMLTQMGKYDRAFRHLNEAIRLNPDSAEGFHNRGNYWLARKDYRLAVADFSSALRIKPGLALTYFNRSIAKFNLGDYQAAYDDALAAQSLGFQIKANDLQLLLRELNKNKPRT
ncbi:MAG: tetratricopeptide repeat protein [Candidatus Margulisiibacteriota bacterium]|jgi:tetratricopeptide (TPR) repeat protein